MAIAFVNAAAAGAFNNSTGDVTNAAQNVTTGNALVVFAMTRGSDATTTASCTDTAGNTYTRVDAATIRETGTSLQLLTFYALNVTGHASNVVTCDLNVTNYVAIVSFQFSGVATASALDVATEITVSPGSPAQTITSSAFTTTQADEVACAGAAVLSNGLTFTAGSGYTIPTNGVDPTFGVGYAQYQIFSGIQTSVTATNGASSGTYTWAQGVITLKGAAAAGIVVPVLLARASSLGTGVR